MGLHRSKLPVPIVDTLGQGTVIPAHPLALDPERRIGDRRQRALTRYYIDSEAGGLPVGVHATQFAIREVGLYEAVLRIAAETAASWTTMLRQPPALRCDTPALTFVAPRFQF